MLQELRQSVRVARGLVAKAGEVGLEGLGVGRAGDMSCRKEGGGSLVEGFGVVVFKGGVSVSNYLLMVKELCRGG